MQETACQKLAPFKSYEGTVRHADRQTDTQTDKHGDLINYIGTRANARRPVAYVDLSYIYHEKYHL